MGWHRFAIQAINARELAPADTAALTVGMMCGGNAANVIPDTASLSGSIRTYSRESREFIKKRIEEIAVGVASSFRGSADIVYTKGCPSTINNEKLVEQFTEYTEKLLGVDQVMNTADFARGILAKLSGSEDFAFVSELVPSIMCVLSVSAEGDAYKFPMHHPKAVFSEEPLYIGAAVYANMAIEWLKNNK